MHVLITYLIRASMRGDGEEVRACRVDTTKNEGSANMSLSKAMHEQKPFAEKGEGVRVVVSNGRQVHSAVVLHNVRDYRAKVRLLTW